MSILKERISEFCHMQSEANSLVSSVRDFFGEFMEMKMHFRYHSIMHLDCVKEDCRYCKQNPKTTQSDSADPSAEVEKS